MKVTIHIEIRSARFSIDRAAWQELEGFLGRVRNRLPADDEGTTELIERHIADLLAGEVCSPLEVVHIESVRRVEDDLRLGILKEKGISDRDLTPRPSRGLHRSRGNRFVAGVCGGLAEQFEWNAGLLRFMMILMLLFLGFSFWLYITLWIVLPNEED